MDKNVSFILQKVQGFCLTSYYNSFPVLLPGFYPQHTLSSLRVCFTVSTLFSLVRGKNTMTFRQSAVLFWSTKLGSQENLSKNIIFPLSTIIAFIIMDGGQSIWWCKCLKIQESETETFCCQTEKLSYESCHM